MALRRTFLILVHFLGLFLLCSTQTSDNCRTPKGTQGHCKVITECPVLSAIVKQRSVKEEDADYLRKSHCGTAGSLPKVCCPLEEVSSTVTPVSSSLLPSLRVCGIHKETRIYGGIEADLKEFPWMALLEFQNNLDYRERLFLCGGSLINNRYILTAAHCFGNSGWSLVNVRLGEHNINTDPDCVKINNKRICNPSPINIPPEEIIVKEGYKSVHLGNDIALVRLTREVQFSDYVKPICLPTTAQIQTAHLDGIKFVVAGWGKTETGTGSPFKLKVEVPYRSNEYCESFYHRKGVNLINSQLCAGGEIGKDSCNGDSGGPLMRIFKDDQRNLNWYCIGVVSYGPSPCGTDWPAVYTKVDNFVQWIVSKLRP